MSVVVAGIGETQMGKYPHRGLHEMIQQAGFAAIKESRVDPDRISAAYIGNFNGQQLASQGHFGPLAMESLGLSHVPALRVEGACASGGLALLQGVEAIRSGRHSAVLVGGVEKMTHQNTATVTHALTSAMDIEFEANTGLTFPGSFALIAHRYFHEYRNIQSEMAQVAVNAHDNALLNPNAQMHKKIDVDKVLSSPRIADPLGLYDCSLVTDGAAFMVLVSEELAAEIGSSNGHRRVKITGSGHGGDALSLHGKKSMTTFSSSLSAAQQAYSQADLKPEHIDLAEVHDCFTITQIINTEDLGFFKKGQGADAVAEGVTARDGAMPINTSGGLKAKGHPIGATGISQAVEIVTQIRGEAGDRQVRKADKGLTHNLGGTAGTCVINIFEGA
ncbi:thiolase domain-containing protein [Corynebacterium ammoniagenes]|uniref:thiolase domain-containing protein n=1 Tax=Corynebacterium ammoniagenes TaxID=1697 RepID=UPI001459D687|nr:thiolase domain-containing protein [Corynebacterium ammoniagenes]NMF31184.1 thiolase domain-containing protein [Corynebacterium ammoniagenes]